MDKRRTGDCLHGLRGVLGSGDSLVFENGRMIPTLEGETTLQRYRREERIEAHAKFHLAQIHLEAEAARKQINEQKCFAARSIGQRRRYFKQGEKK